MPEEHDANEIRFEIVVLPHLDAAYTLARYLLREPADAEDLVQEVFLRAVQYFHTLRDERDARAWLLKIVRRECYSGWTHRRDHGDTISLESITEADQARLLPTDPGNSPAVAAERNSVRERIVDAVAHLPERLREVIILRELQECTYEEIAMIVDVPIGTVMSRISRARAHLATALRGVVEVGEAS